ncbi:hypothetical protein P691DRAFT_138223 [Macrolepiota fuliginosa MF-IS2]|uniref:Uncharacterized protein n=1 Tax=Macrolepiota fuliginosa MF-IS2 TaxID=1400762 RepID=A0A9P6C375_9AGAR|nr:hypothetical protein P691DRAFT_138223 [Macrolepiota fuliginosa MF-IS2]
MTSNPFQEGRTRSQLKLSDDILKISEQSPMKNARDAARKKSDSPGNMDPVDGSEDELLLSPSRQAQPPRSKRSVSPPPGDEYNPGTSEGRDGRELKRMKREMDQRETKDPVKARLIKGGHARTNSEPNSGLSRKAPRKRAGTASSNNKPNSTSNVPTFPVVRSPARAPGKTRAQSVPLFPSFSPLPSLDLRNPPLSPIRARSPSRPPSKYHGLKIHPSPSKPEISEQPPPLQPEAGPDESKIPMEVDEEPHGPPAVELDSVMETVGDPIAPPEVVVQPPKSPTPPAPPTVSSAELPATPAPIDPTLTISMSPLTPLPDTPLPQKVAVVDSEDRYKTEDGWRFDLEKVSIIHICPYPSFIIFFRSRKPLHYSSQYHHQSSESRKMRPVHPNSLMLRLGVKFPGPPWVQSCNPPAKPHLHIPPLPIPQLPKSRSSPRSR